MSFGHDLSAFPQLLAVCDEFVDRGVKSLVGCIGIVAHESDLVHECLVRCLIGLDDRADLFDLLGDLHLVLLHEVDVFVADVFVELHDVLGRHRLALLHGLVHLLYPLLFFHELHLVAHLGHPALVLLLLSLLGDL